MSKAKVFVEIDGKQVDTGLEVEYSEETTSILVEVRVETDIPNTTKGKVDTYESVLLPMVDGSFSVSDSGLTSSVEEDYE